GGANPRPRQPLSYDGARRCALRRAANHRPPRARGPARVENRRRLLRIRGDGSRGLSHAAPQGACRNLAGDGAGAPPGARRSNARAAQPVNSWSTPSRTTSRPSRAIVVRIIGGSKGPAVGRPATSLAPVENRKLPATARNSVPLVSARSYMVSASYH